MTELEKELEIQAQIIGSLGNIAEQYLLTDIKLLYHLSIVASYFICTIDQSNNEE